MNKYRYVYIISKHILHQTYLTHFADPLIPLQDLRFVFAKTKILFMCVFK